MGHPLLRRRLLLSLPLAAATAGGLGFYILLERARQGTYNPQTFSNPLVGHRIPDFRLVGIDGKHGFGSSQLIASKKPILLNFFASWCVPCAGEAPYLDVISKSGVDIWGIAYQDKAEALAFYLAKYGDPYARLATDPTGRTAINFGVYGVPESFLIAPGGIVRWHIAGPLVPPIINEQLRPELQKIA